MAKHGAASSSQFKYDVFLSFRGDVGTRYTFTSHLYRALEKTKRINVFRDEPRLRLGEEIGATLREAIEKSRMSIVVLCQNYASSSWCLDELVHIMKCSDNGRKRPVLPVFYHVPPTEVRYQKNQYEAAMRKHEERYSNKVNTWRSALFAVCELSGKHCTEKG
ncbi:TMV resistance protein N-like [Arachis duranensis]|uniref:TMV resistance protein N-like n=1 Tax=Arachis duranensis TaxID=130453 RepID=A0A9C6TWH9_ARADU|nr:TMV resistance protein N-like [Arachis duranensis]